MNISGPTYTISPILESHIGTFMIQVKLNDGKNISSYLFSVIVNAPPGTQSSLSFQNSTSNYTPTQINNNNGTINN